MNGRCYSLKGPGVDDGSTYTTASSPGPTLKLIAGTTFRIHLENNFVNSVQVETDCHNEYCEMDMTNLHTHGLHISSEQDNVLIDLLPRASDSADPNTHTYEYTIVEDHYPGLHWYHPHNHGSVSHQIHFGMFGAIATEYADESNYADPVLYTDGDATSSYITNILVFSGVYAVNTDLCECSQGIEALATVTGDTNDAREGVGAYGRCEVHGKACFHIYSACYEYCAFEGSRETSGLDYDVTVTSDDDEDDDGIDQFVVVNGVYNPTLSITAGKYRRLQLLNTLHQYYVHYQFPTDCEVFLLGYDGVFLFDAPRDLTAYNNELILGSGSRGDLLVKCDTVGR